jgi:hypothetical protein
MLDLVATYQRAADKMAPPQVTGSGKIATVP